MIFPVITNSYHFCTENGACHSNCAYVMDDKSGGYEASRGIPDRVRDDSLKKMNDKPKFQPQTHTEIITILN